MSSYVAHLTTVLLLRWVCRKLSSSPWQGCADTSRPTRCPRRRPCCLLHAHLFPLHAHTHRHNTSAGVRSCERSKKQTDAPPPIRWKIFPTHTRTTSHPGAQGLLGPGSGPAGVTARRQPWRTQTLLPRLVPSAPAKERRVSTKKIKTQPLLVNERVVGWGAAAAHLQPSQG